MASLRSYAGFSSSCVSTTSTGISSFAREEERVLEVSARQARGVGDDGEHLIAKYLMRFPGQKCGVYSPE